MLCTVSSTAALHGQELMEIHASLCLMRSEGGDDPAWLVLVRNRVRNSQIHQISPLSFWSYPDTLIRQMARGMAHCQMLQPN